MEVWRKALNNLTKYWTVALALIMAVYWFGGFVISVGQIQVEQTSLRVKILEIELRQTKTEDKVNLQNIDVIGRLARMEATLEEIRRKK